MITEKEIIELEKMAKLDLQEAERGEIKKYFDFLTDNFDKKVSAFGIIGGDEELKPMIHGIKLTNVMREDVAAKKFSRETLLKSAPEDESGYFKVPRTVE
jgi:aspartyl-tRNA(Asn)/glutamyl-tRNA(Gln) amidotransferase subunit C